MGKKAKRILTKRNGYWSKRIKGKTHYFGKDYKKAIAEYREQREWLEAGLGKQPAAKFGYTVANLLNWFLSSRLDRVNDGELSQRSYDDYEAVCDMISEAIPPSATLYSLTVEHFDQVRSRLAQGKSGKVGPKTFNRRLGDARTVLRFAHIDNRLMERPLPYLEALKCVPARDIRKNRAQRPAKHLSAEDIRAVLEVSHCKYRLAILLGINGGFNNSDCARLELKYVKPVPDVLVYHRRKTYFERQTPLWPETKKAIKQVIEDRKHYETDLPVLLLSETGQPYYAYERHCLFRKRFYEALQRLGRYAPGKSFTALRTMFAEVGKEVGDDLALKAAMGHSDGSMLYESYARGVYVERIKKITDHVRGWLFGASG